MKRQLLLFFVALFGLMIISLGMANGVSSPKATSLQHKSELVAQMTTGPLSVNIARLGQQFGWPRVVWQSPNDYNWVGNIRITGNSFAAILAKLLSNYPLQAVFYQGNHVLLIRSRTI